MLAGDNVYGQEECRSKELESTNQYEDIKNLESKLKNSDTD
jgi:hypothetical protein